VPREQTWRAGVVRDRERGRRLVVAADIRIAGRSSVSQSPLVWRRIALLTCVGGLGFWIANFAISLTPLAAEYRETLGIQYFSMLLEALLGGLLIGCCVSYCLVRFFDRIPSTSPMVKSLLLCSAVFVVVTVVVEGPAKFGTAMSDAPRYFLVAALFNGLRILALGVAVGYLLGRLDRHHST
jgi:NhaP-type Na+/H+ or K+/H+ antiporter